MIGVIALFIALVAGVGLGWIGSLLIADKQNTEEETSSLESIQKEKEESTMSLRQWGKHIDKFHFSTPLNDGEDFID